MPRIDFPLEKLNGEVEFTLEVYSALAAEGAENTKSNLLCSIMQCENERICIASKIYSILSILFSVYESFIHVYSISLYICWQMDSKRKYSVYFNAFLICF